MPGLTAIRFILSFFALLLPTSLMGATLPVLVKLVVKADQDVAFNAGRKSLDLFKRSLRTDGKQVMPRIYIADELINRGESARARGLIEGCLEVFPNDAKCAASMERIEKLESPFGRLPRGVPLP